MRAVSIPFIAGQWSLPALRLPSAPALRSLNPLHCGAVVASRQLRRVGAELPLRLNPLHCGAVVASIKRLRHVVAEDPVSIPFIAGQWSLPGAALAV